MKVLTGKELPFQALTVFVECVAVGQFRCHANDAVLVVPVSPELVLNKPEIVVEFDLPGARCRRHCRHACADAGLSGISARNA